MSAPEGNQYGLNGDQGRPRKFETVEKLETAIETYFKSCDDRKRTVYDKKKQEVTEINDPEPYTIEGLCLALGILARDTLINYEKKEGYEVFFDTIKKAKMKVQYNKVVNGLDGNYNPAITIFDLKNNHGYKDKTETDITSDGKQLAAPQIYLPTNGRD